MNIEHSLSEGVGPYDLLMSLSSIKFHYNYCTHESIDDPREGTLYLARNV